MRKYVMLTALVLFVGFVQLSPGATWTIDQVTINSEPDIRPSVATIQSAHTMCVHTHNDGDQEVFIAGDMPGTWIPFRVTDNIYTDVATDIASLPKQMMVHFAIWWQNPPYQGISYGNGNPAGWPVEQVTADTEDCSWPSIEVDKNGKAHFAYQKNTGSDQEIFYANNTTGSWVSEQVTDNATDDLYPWLALDSDLNPHIAFTDGKTLYYMKKAAGVWTAPELVAGGADSTSHPYFVLDSKNQAHVCFTKGDGNDEEVYYVNNLSGSWQESKVTDNDYDDLYPTLVVDPNKKAHIAYMAVEPSDAEICYANNATGTWSVEPVTNNDVDDHSYFGRYLRFDPLCRGHIYFWNNQDGDDEIYHARTHEPLYVGVEETPPASSPASIHVSPSPFSSRTTVSYSVPFAGNVSLKVYDVSGCLVKTLVDRTQEQGVYQIIWDGSTDAGTRTAPGVYFYRLEVGELTTSVKGILK